MNGYHRFPARGALRPFIGAGLGYVIALDIDVDRDGTELEYSRKGSAAVQAIVGAEYSLSPRWGLSGDLRWSRIDRGTFKATTPGSMLSGKPRYEAVSLNLGVSFLF